MASKPSTLMLLGRFLPCCVVVLITLLTTNAHAASVAEESELKAAFVYNFTLFTTWPQTTPVLDICVLGGNTYLTLLKKYEGRIVNKATVQVKRVGSASEARGCQVLFIDSSEHEHIDNINRALQDVPVLTVAESGKLSPYSVIILLVRNQDRVTFEINQNAATDRGLTLSSKLLKLAGKVY